MFHPVDAELFTNVYKPHILRNFCKGVLQLLPTNEAVFAMGPSANQVLKNCVGGFLKDSPSKNSVSFPKTDIAGFQAHHKDKMQQLVQAQKNNNSQYYKNKVLTLEEVRLAVNLAGAERGFRPLSTSSMQRANNQEQFYDAASTFLQQEQIPNKHSNESSFQLPRASGLSSPLQHQGRVEQQGQRENVDWSGNKVGLGLFDNELSGSLEKP